MLNQFKKLWKRYREDIIGLYILPGIGLILMTAWGIYNNFTQTAWLYRAGYLTSWFVIIGLCVFRIVTLSKLK